MNTASGEYHFKVRYGSPGKYHYGRGDDINVTDTGAQFSRTTITLHKVIDGNFNIKPISADEFQDDTGPP
ncbi:MAG: hypothetical protein IH898_02260 [Planctomycetes bacterium]|nr:hypothetical protein [Planctomycetota bacterium]